MIQLENKLNIFKRIVYDSKKAQLDDELKALQEKNKKLLDDRRKDLEIEMQDYVERRVQLAKEKKNEAIAKEKDANREAVLTALKAQLEDFLERLEEKAASYVGTEEYKRKLVDDFEEALKSVDTKNLIVAVRPEDRHLLEEKCGEGLTVKFEDLDESAIGGFYMYDDKRMFRINASLHEKIYGSSFEIGRLLHNAMGGEDIG